jgi:hypothetical protein
MSSNKHGNYQRPEITRTNDLVAQDQRQILEYQKKRLENIEKRNISLISGLIKSKRYSNLQYNSDFCYNYCVNEKNTTSTIDSPIKRRMTEQGSKLNNDCFDKCITKRGETFNMLLVV